MMETMPSFTSVLLDRINHVMGARERWEALLARARSVNRVLSCGWHTGELTTENPREEENGPWMEGK